MGGVVANQAFVIGLPSPVIVNTSVEMVARIGVDVVSVNIIEFAVSGSGGVAKGVTVVGVGNKLGVGGLGGRRRPVGGWRLGNRGLRVTGAGLVLTVC